MTTLPEAAPPGDPAADELTYAALVAEGRALIPALDPAWTDHNPSDPGITLLELLAWITEILAYQAEDVHDDYTWSFLALLNGPQWRPPDGPDADLGAAISAALTELERRHRAVTAADYLRLLGAEWERSPEAAGLGDAARLHRVHVVPRRDLTRPLDSLAEAAAQEAHVSIVVVPPPGPAGAAGATGDGAPGNPPEGLTAAVAAFLEPRRLLTTRLHVVGPAWAPVGVSARLGLRDDAPPQAALDGAVAALRERLDPFRGGADGAGRGFGEAVHAAEVYAVLDGLPMVDVVEDVTLAGERPVTADDGSVTALELDAHELAVPVRIELTAYDGYGRPHPTLWEAPR